jgi:hypothetical protein
MPPARRPVGLVVIAVLFALSALSDAVQVTPLLQGGDDDPLALSMLHLAGAITAGAVAVGSWRRARWAPAAAIAWTAVVVTLLVTLGPLLGLPAEARPGLWTSAAAVALVGAGVTWYLRRRVRQSPPEIH